MAKIIDLGEDHKGKRYVVSGAKSRIKDFTHEQDAYAEFYFLESSEWTQVCEDKWLRKKEFTVEKLIAFYYGERCYRCNLSRGDRRRLSKNTLRKSRSSFKCRDQFLEVTDQSITAVSTPDIKDMAVSKSRLLFLKDAYRCAIAHNICVLNPVNELIAKQETGEPISATRHQVDELLRLSAQKKDSRLWLTITIGSRLGLRIGEVNGLCWNSFDRGYLHVSQQRNVDGRMDDCKNRSNRRLNLDESLWLEWLERFDYEFESKIGTKYRLFNVENKSLNEAFRKLAKECGYDLSFHSLRHYCASTLILADEQLTAVSKFLGHKDVATTMRTYAHLIEDKFEVKISHTLQK